MAKVQGPFLSQTASGSVGNALTARRVKGAAVMSMKRVRGTKFPQSRPESISAIRWWNRGNAFKIGAAFLPVFQTTQYTIAFPPDASRFLTWAEVIDYLVAQGDAQLQLKSSRSRRGFLIAQSVINLISLELDRVEEIFPELETAMEKFAAENTNFPLEIFNINAARQYADAFFGPRDIPPLVLHYVWSRIFLDWFAARLPFDFAQGSLDLPEVIAPRREIIFPFSFSAAEKQQGGAAAIPQRATPTPPQLVQTTADLEAALAARGHTR